MLVDSIGYSPLSESELAYGQLGWYRGRKLSSLGMKAFYVFREVSNNEGTIA